MNFYAATLGEVFIVNVFVFLIWLQVLLDAIHSKDGTLIGKRLLLTSSGLVINAVAVAGIMATRAYELQAGRWPYVPYVSGFFIMLGISGFLWIISATIGSSARLLKLFLLVSLLWVAYCTYRNF